MEKKLSESRILVLTYWPFKDALIQTYTLPYLKIMAENPRLKIWLVCLQPRGKLLSREELSIIQQELSQYRITLVPLLYKPLSFGGVINTAFLFLKLLVLTVKEGISTVHAWATPAGALGYLICKVLRRDLVIDSYEPHAESMVENGTWSSSSLAFRILFALERKQSHYAKMVISATEGMRSYAQVKYQKAFNEGFYVKPACVDFELFDYKKKDRELRKSLGLESKIVGIYAGKFGGIYLDIEFFEWLKVATNHWGDNFRLLLLTSHSPEEIQRYCDQVHIDYEVVCQKFVPHQEVPKYMGVADFALTPVKSVPTKRYCTPIKDGEYWAMGLPVIITVNISGDSDIIEKEGIGYVLKELTEIEYLSSMKKIDLLINDPNITKKIVEVAHRYRSFEIAKNVYREVYSK